MCDLNAYLETKGKEELILENVDSLEAAYDKITVSNIFGETRVVKGNVKIVSLREHKIIVIDNS